MRNYKALNDLLVVWVFVVSDLKRFHAADNAALIRPTRATRAGFCCVIYKQLILLGSYAVVNNSLAFKTS